MGARIDREVLGGMDGEPWGRLRIRGGGLVGTCIGGGEIPNVIDEIPVLAVAAALADGVTEIRDAGELRVKESDRIREVVTRLQAMGAEVEEYPDGMKITGRRPLHGVVVDSHGDHRIAMAFAIAGLSAEGRTEVRDTACIDTSYPGFEQTLRAFLP
jgi:3-phosphoshikimate 1-carboxyvinyltransferase